MTFKQIKNSISLAFRLIQRGMGQHQFCCCDRNYHQKRFIKGRPGLGFQFYRDRPKYWRRQDSRHWSRKLRGYKPQPETQSRSNDLEVRRGDEQV